MEAPYAVPDHIIVAGPLARELAFRRMCRLAVKLAISVQENEMTTVPKVTREVLESYLQCKSSQKYLKFSDQAIWLSLSVG